MKLVNSLMSLMNIHLHVCLPDEQWLDDATLSQPLTTEQRAALQERHNVGGRLEMVDDQGQVLTVLDALDEVVPRLCLDALSSLRQGQAVTVALFESSDTVTLSPKGDRLNVTTSWDEHLSLPLEQAMVQLQAAGERLVEFIRRNASGAPRWDDKIRDLAMSLPPPTDAPSHSSPPQDPAKVSDELIAQVLAQQNGPITI